MNAVVGPRGGPRTYLYVPGDRSDFLARATARGAGAIILDLEDGVAPVARREATVSLARWVSDREHADGDPELWLRVDPSDVAAQIAAVIAPPIKGVVVPKAERLDDLLEIGRMLESSESTHGLERGTFLLAPLVESAAGLLAAAELAGAPRVHHLGLGEADLAADLGIDPTEPLAIAGPRSTVVVSSAAAGIAPPIGPVATDLTDLHALATSSVTFRRQGFWGRSAIHPRQVPVIAEAFTPSAEELHWATSVLAAANEAGGASSTGREMIDEAVLRRARRILGSFDSHPATG